MVKKERAFDFEKDRTLISDIPFTYSFHLTDFQSFPDGFFRDCNECDRSGVNLFNAIESITEFLPSHKNSLLDISNMKDSSLASALVPQGYKKRFSENIPKSMSCLFEENDAASNHVLAPPLSPQKLPPIDEDYQKIGHKS